MHIWRREAGNPTADWNQARQVIADVWKELWWVLTFPSLAIPCLTEITVNSSWKGIRGLSDLLKLVFNGKSLNEPGFKKNTVFYFLIFWPCPVTYGILVPQPGIKPMPPAVEAWGLNHWTTEEVQGTCLLVQLASWLWGRQSLIQVGTGSFYKGPVSKYFRLCWPDSPCCSCWTVLW